MRRSLFLLIVLCKIGTSSASNGTDSTQILLLNLQVQIEATQALNDMYNYKFDRAEMQFRWLKQKYGWHPLPYFLLGLSQWWKMVPNIDNTEYDAEFMAYMDTSLVLSERLYEENNEIEGAFFLAATHGFVARLESDRGNWTRAAIAGKNALKYVDIVRENTDFSPEVLFGDAIMNYYTEWIRDNYPVLKPIMWFFPRGDMEKGLEQLDEVAHNAFYTRTEAQYYLMRILANEQNEYHKAFSIAYYLRQTYPDNAYFHRFFMSILYRLGRFNALERESLQALERIDSGMVGYEAVSGRYASYYIAQMNEARGQVTEAKLYYNSTIQFAIQSDHLDSWYAIISNLQLGTIAFKEGEDELSKKHLEMVIEYGNGKKEYQKKAKELLKELYRRNRRNFR
ncbi:MAG: tol-pal system protein YbgF [Bacteroidetes bacterium]|nr:tol-pal system protein YbgF [Bacteroidota bacterium]MDA1122158.1 tol-pal system protein YbgF [Bacteroidota bacterium]